MRKLTKYEQEAMTIARALPDNALVDEILDISIGDEQDGGMSTRGQKELDVYVAELRGRLSTMRDVVRWRQYPQERPDLGQRCILYYAKRPDAPEAWAIAAFCEDGTWGDYADPDLWRPVSPSRSTLV